MIPAQRFSVLKQLWDVGACGVSGEWQPIREISDGVNMPARTVAYALEDLLVMDLLRRERDPVSDGKVKYEYKISDSAFSSILASEIMSLS